MAIEILSRDVVDRIAAGEVVGGPYSVIKELVENALDAGSNEITVCFNEGGRTFLSVEDNGRGMSQKDLSLCILKHATSKLQDKSLVEIGTFGFRGEALPSIGSISRMVIKTKEQGQDMGWQIEVDAGRVQPISPVASAHGTRVVVRDLFYNVPARLKFLKSNSVEKNHILMVMEAFILSYPQVSFKVIGDKDKILFDCKKIPLKGQEQDSAQSGYSMITLEALPDQGFLGRLAAVVGEGAGGNMLPVDLSRGTIKLRGYCSLATYSFATSSHCYIFVNGRLVQDKALMASLRIAYRDVLMKGKFPCVVLFIQTPFEMIDVNVHPAKTKVRFRDIKEVQGIIINGIRGALRKANLGEDNASFSSQFFKARESFSHYASGHFEVADKLADKAQDAADCETKGSHSGPLKISASNQQTSTPQNVPIGTCRSIYSSLEVQEAPLSKRPNQFLTAYQPYPDKPEAECKLDAKIGPKVEHNLDSKGEAKESMFNNRPADASKGLHNIDIKAVGQTPRPSASTAKADIDLRLLPMGEAKVQLHHTYLVSEVEGGIIIIDQHAAHERIVYEKMKDAIREKGLEVEHLVVPEIVNLPQRSVTLLLDYQAVLSQCGISIEGFGAQGLMVRSKPLLLKNASTVDILTSIAKALEDSSTENIILERIMAKCADIACRNSLRAGQKLTTGEMNGLLRSMEQTVSAGQCNHGRPTYIKLTLNEIEKLFARKL